jgi:hypothetical protein
MIKSPAEIILHACIFMLYWAGLFTPEAQRQSLKAPM